jgi:hypothetical protein
VELALGVSQTTGDDDAIEAGDVVQAFGISLERDSPFSARDLVASR